MKSKIAKGLLESRRRFNEQGTEYHYDDVLDIIEIAEQDAEERAVAVAEDFFKEWKDVPIQDWMITEFKEKLNGGQSDGD